jgi:signal transduction histidine kinase
MFGDRKWILPIMAIPIVADLISALTHASAFWSDFLPALYYAAIVFAGIRFGWRTGLGVALLSGASHAMIGGLISGNSLLRLEASVLAFLVVGFALIEERRKSPAPVMPSKPPPESGMAETKECVEQVSAIAAELLREIRTPFASIEGAAYILEENTTEIENRKEFVEIIRCECRRINRVLSEMEECTEIIPLKPSPTDAATLLAEVVRLSALGNPDPGVSLRIEVAPDLPPLWCDATRIEQTLVPFVTSAISGMTGGGELLLSARRDDSQARIQLRVLQQTIHGADPFSGAGRFSSTFDASSGVRVLAARRTVLQHGGTMAVEQTGYTKRLSFLTLPLYNGQTP